MRLEGTALMGSTQTITTKKGDDLQKTKLKVMDMGPEANGGDLYWIDFLGEAALSDEELDAILRQPGGDRGAAHLHQHRQPAGTVVSQRQWRRDPTERADRPAGLALADGWRRS